MENSIFKALQKLRATGWEIYPDRLYRATPECLSHTLACLGRDFTAELIGSRVLVAANSTGDYILNPSLVGLALQQPEPEAERCPTDTGQPLAGFRRFLGRRDAA